MPSEQLNVFTAALSAIKSDLESCSLSINNRLDELADTIRQLTEPETAPNQSNQTAAMSSLYFDDNGAVFAATYGSLIFFSGIARSAAGVFFGVGNELNLVVETADGPSIFLAEMRAVILALESLHFAGHNKVHLIVDSQVCLEVVNSVLEANDSSSLMTIKR